MKSSVFFKYFVNVFAEVSDASLLTGVKKYCLSMLSNFKQCCVTYSLVTNNFHLVKMMNVRDNRESLQDIKDIKLFS